MEVTFTSLLPSRQAGGQGEEELSIAFVKELITNGLFCAGFVHKSDLIINDRGS